MHILLHVSTSFNVANVASIDSFELTYKVRDKKKNIFCIPGRVNIAVIVRSDSLCFHSVRRHL